MKLSFNLHTSARHNAFKLTLSDAPSGSASHLATGLVSKSKGAIEQPRSQGSLLPDLLVGRVGENPGNEVGYRDVIWHFKLPRAFYTRG